VKEEYDLLRYQQNRRAKDGDLESTLRGILEDAQVDNFEELASETNRLQGSGSRRLSILQKLKKKYVKHVESSTGYAVETVLNDAGYQNIAGLRDDLAVHKSTLQTLEDTGKGSSSRANKTREYVRELEETLANVEGILRNAEAAAAACRRGGRGGDKLPYYVDIFHDVENCTCEASLSLDARKLWNETLVEVLTAHLHDPLGSIDRQNTETRVRQMDLTREVHCNWRFCIRLNESNRYHPSQAFVTDLTSCGATHVNVSFKKDAVDTEISKQMSSYRREYKRNSEEGKLKSINVLISSDSDFCKDITSLRQSDCKVMIIYDGSKAKNIFASAMDEQYSLDVWASILARSSQTSSSRRPPLVPTVDYAFPVLQDFDSSKDNNFKETLFSLANYMLQLPRASFPATILTDFCNSGNCNPAAQAVMAKHGGGETFCRLSQGAIEFVEDSHGSTPSLKLQLPYLVRFFVAHKGGWLAGNKLRDFYALFSRLQTNGETSCVDKVKTIYREKKSQGMAKATYGRMIWEKHLDDEDIGYGYFVIPNGDDVVPIDPDKVTKWPIGWPIYYYFKEYKLVLDDLLAKQWPNVTMKLVVEEGRPLAMLKVSVDDDEDAPDIRPMLVRLESVGNKIIPPAEEFVKNYISSLIQYRAKALVQRAVMVTDAELRRLQEQHQVYIFLQKCTDQSSTQQSNTVVIKFPTQWTRPPSKAVTAKQVTSPSRPKQTGGGGRGGGGRGHGKQSVAPELASDELKERLLQFLENEHLVTRDMISGCIIRYRPVPHAELTLTSQKAVDGEYRSKLLAYGLTPSIKFTESFDAIKTLPKQSFIVVYPKERVVASNDYHDISTGEGGAFSHPHPGVLAILDRIRELESVSRVLEDVLVPDARVLDSRTYRPPMEQYFFSAWKFLLSEVESHIDSGSLTVEILPRMERKLLPMTMMTTTTAPPQLWWPPRQNTTLTRRRGVEKN
jgi:hypothetical protein